MPIYSFRCKCGNEFDSYLRLSEYDNPQKCPCGEVAERRICAPMIIDDLPGYQSPIDGRWIEGRKARQEDLKRSGCVEYEPSMVQEREKREAREDALLDKKVDEIVEKEIYSMPAKKKEKLVAELESGADLGYIRV